MAAEEIYDEMFPEGEEQEEQEQLEGQEQEVSEQEEHDHEDKPAVKDDDEPSSVPIHALHEEREKRKQMEARLREMDEKIKRYDTIEEKLAEFQKQKEAEQEEEEAPPPFEYDPTGNLDARLRQMQEIIDKQNEQLTGVTQQTEQQKQIQALGNQIRSSEEKFVAEHEDYLDALNHVRAIERAKIEPIARARGATPEQIEHHLYAQELQAAATLLQLGQDPAEYAYNLAKAYGYQGKQGDGDGDAEKLERLEKGVKNSRTLGSGGKPPSKQDIDKMDTDEFDQAISELFGI